MGYHPVSIQLNKYPILAVEKIPFWRINSIIFEGAIFPGSRTTRLPRASAPLRDRVLLSRRQYI